VRGKGRKVPLMGGGDCCWGLIGSTHFSALYPKIDGDLFQLSRKQPLSLSFEEDFWKSGTRNGRKKWEK